MYIKRGEDNFINIVSGHPSENRLLLQLVVGANVWKRLWLQSQENQGLIPSFAPLTTPATLGKVSSVLGFLLYEMGFEMAPNPQSCFDIGWILEVGMLSVLN